MGFYFPETFNEIAISLILFIVCLIFYKVTYGVWTNRGVKGPVPLPLIGTLYTAFYKDLPSIHLDNLRQYGRIYGVYECVTPQLIISDAKLVKQVSIKDFHVFTNRRVLPEFHELINYMISTATDNKWKRLRKIIAPTFSSGKIKRMKPLIEQCIRNGNEFLETIAAKRELLNVRQFWSRFTLEVIACCCFATNVNSHKEPDNIFLKHVTNCFSPPSKSRLFGFLLYFMFPLRLVKMLPIQLFPKVSMDYLTQVIQKVLIHRKYDPQKHDDFLQLLLEAEKEREDNSEPPLTENEIIANCILFFVVGYETSSTLLHWCTYVLAMHPEIQETLYKEIIAQIDNVESIDYDIVLKLNYLDAFICETLRMYPPLIVTDRRNSVEIEMEGTGIKIPPRTLVTTSIYAMHHDPEYFPEPEKFKPERFLGKNKESIDPNAYLPFGAGPRICIAWRFALFEAKMALISTVMEYKILKSTITPVNPRFTKALIFTASENIFVNIEKRFYN